MTAKEKRELIAWAKKIYSEIDDEETVPIFLDEIFGIAALRAERVLRAKYKVATKEAVKLTRFLDIQTKVIEDGVKKIRKSLC